jgi:tetratricopeptide (TPR) repeat protein
MEAANNRGKVPLSSSAPASGGGDVMPLKLHFEKLSLEVAVPREMGGELSTALQRALDRFADVMERWLNSSLTHPGLLAPPPTEPAQQPQPSAAVVTPVREVPSRSPPSREASVPPRQPILAEELSPLLVEEFEFRPLPAASSTPAAPAEEVSRKRLSETRPSPTANETAAMAAGKDSAVAEVALAQVQQGERHRLAGHKKAALTCYEAALALAPDCVQAYLERASIYIEQGRFQEALLDCNSALRQQPERAVLYVLRGLVYTRLGNVRRALDEAEDAIRFDPSLPSAYMLRGTVRFKNGMINEALSDVKQAIRLRPGDAKFRAELARLLTRMGKYEQAAHVYAQVLELAPNFHEARLHRAAALRQAGDAALAEAELTEYLRCRPQTAAAHYQRGLCRLARRNYVQAMSDFDKAIALDPKDKAAYQAKEQTLKQWEATARQDRAQSGSAASVARAATALDALAAETAPAPALAARPMPVRPRPAKSTPSPAQEWQWSDNDPGAGRRRVKWVCVVALVGLLSFGGYRALANFIHDPNRLEEVPPASAKLSAEQLFERYKSNPDTAKAEFSGHVLEVTGVAARQPDDKVPPVVVLYAASANVMVKCTLKANLSYRQQMQLDRIEEQTKVTVVGKCAGAQGNDVVLNDCQVINVIRGYARTRR